MPPATATAEVIGAGPDEVSADDCSRMIWIRVRVSGAESQVEAGCLMPHGVAGATAGAEIKAVVDPGGKAFRLL
ncbi:hypothetical protein C5746_14355 [Streptomyces atratus]|uniref:Uncharacterized protein n=1 Tax=Streptomyces atratus TaxID=1893 RepID=A0A2Z5JCI8_STRAR|nr:hypothetical protein C5746_14355 [Streptomyces atratus]